jgi:hypothetical protein
MGAKLIRYDATNSARFKKPDIRIWDVFELQRRRFSQARLINQRICLSAGDALIKMACDHGLKRRVIASGKLRINVCFQSVETRLTRLRPWLFH